MNKPQPSADEKPGWRKTLYEQIGEDPAELLNKPLIPSNPARSSPLLHARARIRGIDYFEVLNAYEATERRLAAEGHIDGPREQVLEWIENRREFLEEHGERDERMDLDGPTEVRVLEQDNQKEKQIEYFCGTCHTSVEERTHGYYCPECDHLTRDVLEANGGESV